MTLLDILSKSLENGASDIFVICNTLSTSTSDLFNSVFNTA